MKVFSFPQGKQVLHALEFKKLLLPKCQLERNFQMFAIDCNYIVCVLAQQVNIY